jgi:hypothetical protein
MRQYSPKRRTALVLTGSGSTGAYLAGALKALDESGVKLDLVVGSGAGTVAAAFAAVAGGARLWGDGGFWHGLSFGSLYRLRAPLRVAAVLLLASFVVFVLPLVLALLAGLLFPLLLIVDLLAPGWPAGALSGFEAAPAALRAPYLAALAAPVFALSVFAVVALLRTYACERRRLPERFETPLDAARASERLRRSLWEVARGTALSGAAPAPAELSRKYVALLVENLGQPGFRELVLRSGDLESGRALPFVVLQEQARAGFAAARARERRSRLDGLPDAVDLRSGEHASLLFDAVKSGLLPPLVAPPLRMAFPRGGIFAGETRRLADASLVSGSGLQEALDAGAEQVILVSGSPEQAGLRPRRRGPLALADAVLAALERQALERDLEAAERVNRMVQTLGHVAEDGTRAWEDPATGKLHREFSLYVIRPQARALGPLELDGALDPASEVEQTLADLLDQGHRDAYRQFVEPVVGALPEPAPAPAVSELPEGHAVTL